MLVYVRVFFCMQERRRHLYTFLCFFVVAFRVQRASDSVKRDLGRREISHSCKEKFLPSDFASVAQRIQSIGRTNSVFTFSLVRSFFFFGFEVLLPQLLLLFTVVRNRIQELDPHFPLFYILFYNVRETFYETFHVWR